MRERYDNRAISIGSSSLNNDNNNNIGDVNNDMEHNASDISRPNNKPDIKA